MPADLSRRIEDSLAHARGAAPATTSCSTSSGSASPAPSSRWTPERRHRLPGESEHGDDGATATTTASRGCRDAAGR
jgi:hypothetical protein